MRGGGRLTCSVAAKKPLSPYLLPRRICEAADALFCRRRLLEAAGALRAADDHWRPQSQYLRHRCLEDADVHLLPRRGCEAALVLLAADGHWTPRSLYLPPRLGCEAAVALHCLLEDNWRPQSTYLPQTTTGGGSRPTCRRRSLEAAVDLSAASPWMRGGC